MRLFYGVVGSGSVGSGYVSACGMTTNFVRRDLLGCIFRHNFTYGTEKFPVI